MAQLVVAIGTSHAPQLSTPPEEWGQRAEADRRNKSLIYKGEEHTYDEVNEIRAGAFAQEISLPLATEKFDRARKAINALGDVLRAAKVDVLVIVSSDHKETYNDEMLAPFTIYWGDTVQHEPYTQADLDEMPPGIAIAEVANQPSVSTTRETHGDLALHLISESQAAGFDPAASERLPEGKYKNFGIPHGWGFILQQVLGGENLPPFVPVFVNTFWQPNPPTARRSYEFGVALGEAIASYPKDIRVGVVASGGLSHFVIDEELDRGFLAALQAKDADQLMSYPDAVLRGGTSEMRNWIAVAGAVAGSKLQARVVDYLPEYRSEAGTGCGMGFVAWDREGA